MLVADRGCWLLHRLLNPAFLYALLRLRSTCHAGNNAKVFYEAVLPYVVVYYPSNVRACATLTLGTRTGTQIADREVVTGKLGQRRPVC